jgi:hypothetical protein
MDIVYVLAGHAGFEGVRQTLVGPAARTTIRRTLGGMLASSQSLGPCRLRRAKFRMGRKLAAYYDVRVGARTYPIGVTWAPVPPPAPGPELLAMEREAIDRHLADPFQRLVAEVAGQRMRVEIAPLDVAFPQLVRVSDPVHVGGLLGSAGSYRVTPIRYRPRSRHLLRYESCGEAARRQVLYAKLYRDSDRSLRAHRLATLLGDLLAANVTGLAAARPLAVFPDDALLLYPGLVGTPLSGQLTHRADLGSYLREVGIGLRALHGLPASLAAEQQPHRLGDEVRRVRSATEHLTSLLPEVGQRIGNTLDHLQHLHGLLPEEPLTFVYGDLKADHVWITRRGLVLIDFDTCRCADPALDVGKFLADLRWWHDGCNRPGLIEAQAAFLAAYNPDPARLARARIYEVLVLAKITAHRVRLFDRGWPQRTARLIDHTEAMLSDLETAYRRQFGALSG